MTIKELSKYHNIKLEIEQLESAIKELENTVIGSTKITDIPSTHNVESPVEIVASRILKLKEKLSAKRENGINEYEKIEMFLDSVSDINIRIIIRKRFLEGKSWDTVGKEIHADRTTAYYRLMNYLNKVKKEGELNDKSS